MTNIVLFPCTPYVKMTNKHLESMLLSVLSTTEPQEQFVFIAVLKKQTSQQVLFPSFLSYYNARQQQQRSGSEEMWWNPDENSVLTKHIYIYMLFICTLSEEQQATFLWRKIFASNDKTCRMFDVLLHHPNQIQYFAKPNRILRCLCTRVTKTNVWWHKVNKGTVWGS